MNINEPKRKHYGLVTGVAIAVLLGLFRGTRMQASSQSDFLALLIAFLIILGVCGGIGFFIDSKLHERNKHHHYSQLAQEAIQQEENQ